MRLWSYPLLDDLWVIGGAENSGGLVVDWFQKNMMPAADDNFTAMMQAAAGVPAGSDGLIFLPYLFGERAPIWDVTARGALIGLGNQHTPAHMARAMLEGTVYALYDVYQALCDTISPITEIRVSGGYTRSPFWLSVQASMFGKALVVMEDHECSALGAALLGFLALGIFPDLKSGASKIKIKETILPDPIQIDQYQKIIPLYTSAFQQLKPIFEALQRYRLENVN
jgi:gluconokinase